MCGLTVNVKTSLLALIAISVVVRHVDAKRSRRIIGGQFVEFDGFPWMARLHLTLISGKSYECGGAIISSRHILTSGKCLTDSNVSSIWTGSNVRDYNVTLKSTHAKIVRHPKYNSNLIANRLHIKNDIGIIVLDKDLQLNKNQNVILLINKRIREETRAVLSGWGFVNKCGEHALILQKTSIKILLKNKCSAIEAKQLCGQSNPEATPYYHDEGSPLVAHGRIVGILSSHQFSLGTKSIYTNIYYYRDWIERVVNETVEK